MVKRKNVDFSSKTQIAAHRKAYILGLISGILMLEVLGNRVHLMYLYLLADFEWVDGTIGVWHV